MLRACQGQLCKVCALGRSSGHSECSGGLGKPPSKFLATVPCDKWEDRPGPRLHLEWTAELRRVLELGPHSSTFSLNSYSGSSPASGWEARRRVRAAPHHSMSLPCSILFCDSADPCGPGLEGYEGQGCTPSLPSTVLTSRADHGDRPCVRRGSRGCWPRSDLSTFTSVALAYEALSCPLTSSQPSCPPGLSPGICSP